ncbi:MAG: alpha/beta hydrolase [Halioglobus sp.]
MNKKYDIHPDFAKFPTITLRFNALLMALINTLMRLMTFFTKRSFDLTVSRHKVSSADGSAFPVITMTPQDLQQPAPALVYYHGGAFAMPHASLHLENCERYANEAGCVVVFVDYRLAPKHPFPCGFEDCYAALQWTIQQAQTLGIDIQRIAVGGDSAGGALAAGVAQKARDDGLIELCAQLLIYPVLDNTCTTVSATEFIDVPLWNAVSNYRMWEMYLSRYRNTLTPPYAAPTFGELSRLPFSYVETAQFDPLRDEGMHYAESLESHGVSVVRNDTQRTIHGYDGASKSAISKASMLKRIAFLREAFSAKK